VKDDDLPCRVDLVAHLPEAKVALDRVAQRTALVTRAAPIDDDDDVLQATREIRVPVDVERSAHYLRARPTISVKCATHTSAQEIDSPLLAIKRMRDRRTRGRAQGTLCVQNRPCVVDVIRPRSVLH
jgi:hypothetical protein